jgi:putative SOS response-associated peptidase YedK
MCNDYRLKLDIDRIREDFSDIRIRIRFPEGVPNMEPRDDIKITDTAPVVRAALGGNEAADLVQRRWSWPGPTGKPVYNFRSEGREFGPGRCLILADGFYEFTTPDDPKKKRKDKWLFTKQDEDWFCIAGIIRPAGQYGEAFTMLTMEPGLDMAPYHSRQIAVLNRGDWSRWLDPSIPAADILKPLPPGSLHAEQVG